VQDKKKNCGVDSKKEREGGGFLQERIVHQLKAKSNRQIPRRVKLTDTLRENGHLGETASFKA